MAFGHLYESCRSQRHSRGSLDVCYTAFAYVLHILRASAPSLHRESTDPLINVQGCRDAVADPEEVPWNPSFEGLPSNILCVNVLRTLHSHWSYFSFNSSILGECRTLWGERERAMQ